MCAIFSYKDFDDVKIYFTLRFAVITKEGPDSEIFPDDKGKEIPVIAALTAHIEDKIEVPVTGGNLADTISEMRAKDILVDKNNEPIEENLPTATNPNTAEFEKNWSGDVIGIYNQRKDGHHFERDSFGKQPSRTSKLD